MSRDQLKANAIVVEDLKHDAYRVELRNGHRCIAKAPRNTQVSVGDKVSLEFHPYDLSRAHIVTE